MSKYNKQSLEKLLDKSDELEEQLANLKLKHSQGKLRDTAKLKKLRQELARVNTVINIKSKEIKDE